MAYGMVVLNGTTLTYNPVSSQNPPFKNVQKSKTFGGNYFTEFGIWDSDRPIKLSWPILPKLDYDFLKDTAFIPGTVVYQDEYGEVWNVYCMAPTYETLLAGGGEFYSGVEMILLIADNNDNGIQPS